MARGDGREAYRIASAQGRECRSTPPQARCLDILLDASGYAARVKDYEAAEREARAALEIAERELGPDHEYTAISVNDVGFRLHQQKRYAEAEPFLARALQRFIVIFGRAHESTRLSIANMAAVHAAQGEYREAEPLLRETLADNERVHGRTHATTTRLLFDLTNNLLSQGRAREAEVLARDLVAREPTGPNAFWNGWRVPTA
jgi:tetratricopeptide (TPR) repeat protein